MDILNWRKSSVFLFGFWLYAFLEILYFFSDWSRLGYVTGIMLFSLLVSPFVWGILWVLIIEYARPKDDKTDEK